MTKAKIIGTGHALPLNKINNQYFVDLGLQTSDEWIVDRTGIEHRHILGEKDSTSVLAIEAAQNCIKDAGIDKSQIELIIVATTTPDYLGFPSTACLVQKALEIPNIGAFDLAAACTGFTYAMGVASSMIESGQHKHILVIGADCLSKWSNWSDRGTCILFGDAAGAVILSATEDDTTGVLYSKLYADGNESDALKIPEGGTKTPFNANTLENKAHTIQMDGRAVFKVAINKTIPAIKDALESLNLTTSDIDYLICHQANQRILSNIGTQLNLTEKQLVSNIKDYGNTSAASIPLALSELDQKGALSDGDLLVFAGFGAGFTWGVTLLKWSKTS